MQPGVLKRNAKKNLMMRRNALAISFVLIVVLTGVVLQHLQGVQTGGDGDGNGGNGNPLGKELYITADQIVSYVPQEYVQIFDLELTLYPKLKEAIEEADRTSPMGVAGEAVVTAEEGKAIADLLYQKYFTKYGGSPTGSGFPYLYAGPYTVMYNGRFYGISIHKEPPLLM